MNKDELSNVLQKQIKKKEDALRTQKEKKIQVKNHHTFVIYYHSIIFAVVV